MIIPEWAAQGGVASVRFYAEAFTGACSCTSMNHEGLEEHEARFSAVSSTPASLEDKPFVLVFFVVQSSSASSIDAEELGEHRHAHEHAVGDLLEDQRALAVGDVARDFDTAVDRPGMHDDALRLRATQTLGGQPVAREILGLGRNCRGLHALLLQT